ADRAACSRTPLLADGSRIARGADAVSRPADGESATSRRSTSRRSRRWVDARARRQPNKARVVPLSAAYYLPPPMQGGGGAGGMSWLWAVFTVAASGGQVARNAMQKELTATLGTVGATQVRFLFGLPFALAFLAIVLAITQLPLPTLNPLMIGWTVTGA